MTDEQPLLGYAIATSPNPLQASSTTTPSRDHITIAVSVPADETIHCDSIQFAVPKADPDTPGFDSAPGWSLSSDKKWKWLDTWLDDTHTPSYYRAAIVPADDNQPIEYGVSVGITGTLGTETGTLTCLLREHSGTNEATLTYKEGSFIMPVDPQAFYLNNFLALDPGSPNVPRTRFSDGDTFVLSWESNGTNFTLYDGDGNVLYDGPDTSCTLIPPVYPGDQPPAGCIQYFFKTDTTFTLCATLTSGAAQSRNDFEPIYQYATLTVTTAKPIFDSLNVFMGGQTTLMGPVVVTDSTELRDGLRVSWHQDDITTIDGMGLTMKNGRPINYEE
ncbi:hypothetical protein AB0M34_13190 [Nocardia sp. NPDC050193]